MEQENADLDGFLESDAPLLSARLSNSETLGNLSNVLGHLDDDQRQDVVELVSPGPVPKCLGPPREEMWAWCQ